MELRRICKHNYAMLSVILFYASAMYSHYKAILYQEFCNRQKILLDFSQICGIIVLT